VTKPICVAYDQHFRIRCGEPAVATASLDARSGAVCAEHALLANRDGWTITWDREQADGIN